MTRAWAAGALALLCAFGSALPAAAETPSPAPGSPSASPSAATTRTTFEQEDTDFALTISPTRLVVDRDVRNRTQQILVVNRGRAPVDITVQKRNFTAAADGSLSYAEDAPYAAASWMRVTPERFTAVPGQSQTVTAEISVPPNPEPGDHQAALIFLVPPGKAAGNVRISRGVGTPVFVAVPGPVDDSVSIRSLDAPAFAARGPVTLTAQVQNTGNTHRDFRGPGALKVTGVGGAPVFPDFTVSRGATRDLSTAWDPPLLCICRPTLTIDNSGVLQSVTVRVVVFPWHLLLIAFAVSLVLFLLMQVGRRSYRASVLRAAARLQPPASSGDG